MAAGNHGGIAFPQPEKNGNRKNEIKKEKVEFLTLTSNVDELQLHRDLKSIKKQRNKKQVTWYKNER